MIPTVVDGIKKPLQARLTLSDSQREWFVRLFYLTWLPAMPLAGFLLDSSWNLARIVLFFGLVGLVLGFAWLALTRSVPWLNLNAIVLGIAYSCFTTAAIWAMSAVITNEQQQQRTIFFDNASVFASLNLGFVAVGSGALVGPWIVALIDRWWGCRQGLLYLSILCILPAVMTALCERDQFPVSVGSAATWEDVVTHPHMVLIAGVILIYFAIENCLEFWPDLYLKVIGYEGRGMNVTLLVFWLAFIATRLVAAWWLYEHPSHGLFLTIGLLIASAIILGNLTAGVEIGGGSLGFWLVGACYGPLLPGFLGIAMTITGKPLSASVLGGLLALSGLDTFVVRPLMSGFGHDRDARSVMRVPTVLAIVLAAPLLLLAFL
jgi:MFS family permease